jgi:hypothetical protein
MAIDLRFRDMTPSAGLKPNSTKIGPMYCAALEEPRGRDDVKAQPGIWNIFAGIRHVRSANWPPDAEKPPITRLRGPADLLI